MLEPPGAVEGRVACEDSSAPGAGLWVRAYGRFLGVGARAAARCDPHGKYSLTGLPPGDYTVRVRLGHGSRWISTYPRGIQVLPGQTVRDADVRLIEGGIVSGMVIDATTAEPVAGVSVGERFPERWAHERTRTDGRFRLRLPMGMRSVCPSGVPAGYVKPDSNDALVVTARDGRTSAGPIFELQRSVTLEGKVVDPSQQPVAAAMVTAWLPKRRRVWTWGPEPYPVSGTTDGHGAFRLAGMPPDEQVLLEVIALRARLGASLDVIPDRGPGKNVLVRLVPLATVTGRVVDKEGRAVADARATLSYPGMVRMGGTIANPVTRTGSDGRYEFVVAPGRELVIKVGRDKSPRVVPEAGQRHELKDIVTQSHIMADVCGRVVDADGEPVYLARVALRAAWYRELTTATDERGEFRFHQVHSEGSSIRIAAQDRQGVLFGQARIRSFEGLGPVEVRLARTCGVAGRVVSQEGLPVSAAQVELLVSVGRGSFGIASTRSDGKGRYRFERLRGRMVPLSGRAGRVSVSAAGYGSGSSKRLRFETGRILTADDIVLRRANSSVSGTVTDTDGTPLAGVSVNCGGMHAYTNVRGRYRIEGLPGNRARDVHVGHRRYHRDSRRSVQPGSTDIDFALTPKSPSKATVRAAVGMPAPEPRVRDWLNTPSLTLSDLRGRAVLICFWTRYSRPCVRSMQRLNRLSKQHSDRLITIAIHDRAAPAAEVKEFVKENHIEFPVGIVKSTTNDGWHGETFSAYGIKSLPATFLVDKKGVLRYAHISDGLEGKVATLVEE